MRRCTEERVDPAGRFGVLVKQLLAVGDPTTAGEHRLSVEHVLGRHSVDWSPEIAVPLLPGDPTITVDLQAGFDRSCDSGPFRREVHYREEMPDPPLSPEQLAWARGRIEPLPR